MNFINSGMRCFNRNYNTIPNAEDLELGLPRSRALVRQLIPQRFGTCLLASKDIFQNFPELKEPPQAPGTAAGDAKLFLPRQIFLLKEQYLDQGEYTAQPIGSVVRRVLGKVEGAPSIIDLNTAEHLNVLSAKEKTIADAIGSTKTKQGWTYLRLLLTRPTDDIEVLQKRQEMLKALVGRTDLTVLEECLGEIGEEEIPFLSHWDTKTQLPGFAANLYYKSTAFNQRLNNSAFALDAGTVWTIFNRVVNVGTQCLSGVALSAFAGYETVRGFSETSTPNQLTNYADRFIGTTPVGPLGTWTLSLGSPPVNVTTAALAAALCFTSLRNAYGWLKADASMVPLMRDVLCSVSTQCKNMKKMYEHLKEQKYSEGLEHFSCFEDLLFNEDPDVQNFLKLMESRSFNKQNSLFRPGEVLLAWELLHSSSFKPNKKGKTASSSKQEAVVPGNPAAGDKIRAAFEKAMPAVAEIDAFLAVARLMKQEKDNYCFPEFIKNEKGPVLQLTGVWNPEIDPKKAKKIDFSIGGDVARGAVITGPNTFGKSCAGKGITDAVVMAHSLGIAPAKMMKLTPLRQLRTYKTPKDSVEQGSPLLPLNLA